MNTMNKPYIFVIGNEKGGAGKTTCSMHLIIALLYQNYSVVSIDTDSRQSSLTNYLKNRDLHNKQNPDKSVLVPKHFHISESEVEEQAKSFEQILKNNQDVDYVVIDTPGSYTPLSRVAHSYANTIITPINDSFLDLDVIAKVDSKDEIISHQYIVK